MSLQSFLNLWNPCFQRRRQQIGTPVYFHRIYKTLCNYCWITATSWGHLDKFTLGISFCTPLIFFFFLPMSVCIYRAVDKKTHKVEKTGLCTERGSVYIVNLGVETPRATREETSRPVRYLHSERGRLLFYTLSLAGTCVHLEWFTVVIVVLRKKSLSPPPTSSLLMCLF